MWEGVPRPQSPGAPRLRSSRSVAGGTRGCGMSRPKMVSVPGDGGGGIGPSGGGACIPTGCWSVSGPRQDSSWRLEPGARLAITRVWRQPLGVGARASCAARRDEGDQVQVGTDLAADLRITQGPPPLVSPLPSRHSPLPGSPGPLCAAPQIVRARPHRGPALSS